MKRVKVLFDDILYHLSNINVISVAITILLIMPVLMGIYTNFSKENIRDTIDSIGDNIEFLLSLVLSIYLTRKIFFEQDSFIFKAIYDFVPDYIKEVLFGQDIITYLVCVPLLLLFIMLLLKLIFYPVYSLLVASLSEGIYRIMSSVNWFVKAIVGILCQLPKALFTIFLFGLLINFFSYYFYSPLMSKWLSESRMYQILYSTAVEPALNSNIAKNIPVILNDSFAIDDENTNNIGAKDIVSFTGEIAKNLSKGNFGVIEYFNGVTLDEAVKSTEEIDNTARRIVGDEKDSKKKAYLIYKWITANIKYDYDKAVEVSKGTKGIDSGSKSAFETRKGICFDYSCLYISMCRAVGLKSSLVTGLGYSGITWGDHAWNRVYYEGEERWIDVDTTFGTAGNYFDKPDFGVDHKHPEVQGVW